MVILPFAAMASDCEICLAGLDQPEAGRRAQGAIAEVLRIESKYSRYRNDSVVGRINAGGWVEVDAETNALLDYAAALYESSEGLFDITSGVLRRAWNFKSGRPPAAEAVADLLPLVGWEMVDRDGERARLAKPGMEIDFGGFGKEYAADRAAAILQAAGCHSGYVNLGGDLRVLGPQPDGSPWRIGIQHPRQPGALIAHIEVSAGALATSGDYERFFEYEGRRYCHILDPRSGQPVRHFQSVSVLAPLCVAAGSLSTIAMLKQAQGLDFLDDAGQAYLVVNAEGQLRHRDTAPLT